MSQQFPVPLRLEWTAPRKARLLEPFVFISPTQGRIEVESGFDTDYASIPRLFWSLYPPDGTYTKAAVVHDHAYWYQYCTRDEADALLMEGMMALGVPWLRRHIIHKAVWAGGWLAWGRNTKARELANESPIGATRATEPQP